MVFFQQLFIIFQTIINQLCWLLSLFLISKNNFKFSLVYRTGISSIPVLYTKNAVFFPVLYTKSASNFGLSLCFKIKIRTFYHNSHLWQLTGILHFCNVFCFLIRSIHRTMWVHGMTKRGFGSRERAAYTIPVLGLRKSMLAQQQLVSRSSLLRLEATAQFIRLNQQNSSCFHFINGQYNPYYYSLLYTSSSIIMTKLQEITTKKQRLTAATLQNYYCTFVEITTKHCYQQWSDF